MKDRLQLVSVAGGYTNETLKFARPLKRLTVAAGHDQATQAYLDSTRPYQVASMGLPAVGYYDMLHPRGTRDQSNRRTIWVNAAHTLLTIDIADDVVDERRGSIKEKCVYLRDVSGLMSGKTPMTDLGQLRSDPEKAAAVDIARRVKNAVQGRQPDPEQAAADLVALEQTCNPVINELEAQFTETDPQRLLDLTVRLGAGCYDLMQVHVDIADGRSSEQNFTPERQAGRHLGSYAHILDHLYELDHDLKNGQFTYATARIRAEGDSPGIRSDIKEKYLDKASDLIRQGKELLTPEQIAIYSGLRLLLDVKYRAIARFRGKAEEKKRAPVAATVVYRAD